ncbi:KilA-N domain-containing protein [Parabacteroides sp. AF17-3]|uniref:KilA-N domain-containing protein n=1 Tax=Parabacteroides sp. AF17-3 TaxID=2293113 RepID=UPI001F2FA63B|nr:KilA-N domain-containing protein [Parabacteroides sp. AF17-3]
MSNYINNILKRGSFEFEGSNIKYAVNSVDKVVWFQLADICSAIQVKNWFMPDSKDYVLEKLTGKRKTSFIKSHYTWGIQETDVIWFLEGYAETDSIRGDRALRLQKVIKAFVKSEKLLGIPSFGTINAELNLNGYTYLREKVQQDELPVTNLPVIFSYGDNPVTFKNVDGTVMVNATEMAKGFAKKEVRQWFDNNNTTEIILAIAEKRGLITEVGKTTSLNASSLAKMYPSLINVVKGGIPGKVKQGTWMHEDVALEFARWLSPKFAIWCNDKIKELMKTGSVSIKPEVNVDFGGYPIPAKFSDALILAAHLQQTVEIQEAKIAEDQPKVEYYSNMVENRDYFTTTTIATELRTSAQILNQYLSKRGVLKGCTGVWTVTDEHQTLLVPSPFKSIIRWNHEGRTLIRQLWEEREEELVDA